MRGVAFDFRVKARNAHKAAWNHLFALGSLVTTLAQGWMLGRTSPAFIPDLWSRLFAVGIALTLPAAYAMLGVGWLVMKTEGELQRKALRWGQGVLRPMGFCAGGHLAGHTGGEPDGVQQVVCPARLLRCCRFRWRAAAFFAIPACAAAPGWWLQAMAGSFLWPR